MKQNLIFVLTITAMLATVLFLHGCTAIDKGDTDTRDVRIVMHATAAECFVEVNGGTVRSATDGTKTVSKSILAGG